MLSGYLWQVSVLTKLLIIGALIVLLCGTNQLRSLSGNADFAIKSVLKSHERMINPSQLNILP